MAPCAASICLLQAMVDAGLLLHTKQNTCLLFQLPPARPPGAPCVTFTPAATASIDCCHCRDRQAYPCNPPPFRERFGRAFATLREAFGAPAAWRLWFDLAESVA